MGFFFIRGCMSLCSNRYIWFLEVEKKIFLLGVGSVGGVGDVGV